MMKVDFVKDNMYIWHVTFDLTKFDVSDALKEDFRQRESQYKLKSELVFEVIFSENYPHSPFFIRVI